MSRPKADRRRPRIAEPVSGVTIAEAFYARVSATPDHIACIHHRDGSWRRVSWMQLSIEVDRWRREFARMGSLAGERIALSLKNGPDWIACDIAAMAQGLVTVPLYQRDSADNARHILRQSGAGQMVIDCAERLRAITGDGEPFTALATVWLTDGGERAADMPSGSRILPAPNDAAPDIPRLPLSADAEGLATIIYTSGTTGLPKGVMHGHRELLWSARALHRVNPVVEDDVFLSILPLAHCFERIAGWLLPMLTGATIAYVRSIDHLHDDFTTIRPTVMLAVPRLFERIRTRIERETANHPLRTMILRKTLQIGWRRRLARQGERAENGLFAGLFWMAIGRRVAARIKDIFGGRIRLLISGGAAIDEKTARFIAAMEIPFLEGYGLTEAGAAVSCSTPDTWRIGRIGHPLPDVELRIDADGELLVRSPGLMRGYWQDPAASDKAIDLDGWLHTGDRAALVDGYVRILGRIKDILVLSNGENVTPTSVEAALQSHPLVLQACVLGDNRPWCCAIVVVDMDAWSRWMGSKGYDATDPNERQARALLLTEFGETMKALPAFARIRAIHAETEPWGPDGGLLTPTLKAKRRSIEERYAAEIEALYRSRET
jgi:long-chain acyl-CoA synthetase